MTFISQGIVREGYGTLLGEVRCIVVYGPQPIISIIQVCSKAIRQSLLIEYIGCFTHPKRIDMVLKRNF